AGGVGANRIARVNPNTGLWSALGSGVRDGAVFALAVLPDGDVIVSGQFSMANLLDNTNSIARYNPTTSVWSSLGSVAGNGNTVRALAILPMGDLIVGGNFSSAGLTTSAWGIARARLVPAPPVITAQPPVHIAVQTKPNVLDAVTISVSAAGDFGSSFLTHRWRKGGVTIDTSTNPSAATATLTLTNVQPADAGVYDCLIGYSCGGPETISDAATVSVSSAPSCPADLNGDRQVDDDDFQIFVLAYNIRDCADPSMPSGCPADLNSDAFVDDADVSRFAEAYDVLLCP
ncbi:MAG: hypothetical protein ACK58T_15560, partial [Phycisphaerae bacterium]